MFTKLFHPYPYTVFTYSFLVLIFEENKMRAIVNLKHFIIINFISSNRNYIYS